MTKLSKETVLRLAEEAREAARLKWNALTDVANKWPHISLEEQLELAAMEFAALIQAELEKSDTEVTDTHDLLDRHQIPRQTSFGIPLSLMGRIALAITGDAK